MKNSIKTLYEDFLLDKMIIYFDEKKFLWMFTDEDPNPTALNVNYKAFDYIQEYGVRKSRVL